MNVSRIISAIAAACIWGSGAPANDLTDALESGALWQKDRDTVCSTDFVGLRYAPIDEYSIRLLPRLSVTPTRREKCEKSKLTIGDLQLGETLVHWDASKQTHNMEAWIFNRGDNGDISMKQYKELLLHAVTQLNKLTRTEEYVEELRGISDEDHVALRGVRYWRWEWPNGFMLLEASASEQKGGKTRPEFIRLKLGRDAQAVSTGGADNMAAPATLKNNVMKNKVTGDTLIMGVPMVDQGEKGYCVPASVARIFAYCGMDAVDQHALAQLCNSDADKGTYTSDMYRALRSIGKKFHYRITNLVSYGESPGNHWLRTVRNYVDAGVPLLWGVQLGIVREAGIPISRENEGHMRLIIGYNNKTKHIYYTDSWGAGHELKCMSVKDARRITREMYVISPTQK